MLMALPKVLIGDIQQDMKSLELKPPKQAETERVMETKTMNTDRAKEVKEYAIDKLSEYKDTNIYGCDMHNELFNTDYYIIGTYKSKQWLGDDAFNVIGEIKDYEQDNFGEVTTDLSDPENIVNMYVYIIGEQILAESDTLNDNWDNHLTNENIDDIITELKG